MFFDAASPTGPISPAGTKIMDEKKVRTHFDGGGANFFAPRWRGPRARALGPLPWAQAVGVCILGLGPQALGLGPVPVPRAPGLD